MSIYIVIGETMCEDGGSYWIVGAYTLESDADAAVKLLNEESDRTYAALKKKYKHKHGSYYHDTDLSELDPQMSHGSGQASYSAWETTLNKSILNA